MINNTLTQTDMPDYDTLPDFQKFLEAKIVWFQNEYNKLQEKSSLDLIQSKEELHKFVLENEKLHDYITQLKNENAKYQLMEQNQKDNATIIKELRDAKATMISLKSNISSMQNNYNTMFMRAQGHYEANQQLVEELSHIKEKYNEECEKKKDIELKYSVLKDSYETYSKDKDQLIEKCLVGTNQLKKDFHNREDALQKELDIVKGENIILKAGYPKETKVFLKRNKK